MPLHPDQNLHMWEPHIQAFVELCQGDAPQNGPLAGLRVGVKDIIDVVGVPTRNGSETYRDAKPAPQDAAVVAKLRGAGAHIIGKTTTTEFAFTDPTSCRNPHDLRRSPGGSSSGSGAAVAAGVLDIALGTQTAGSLCRPAAYCGAVGFKPSYDVLPKTGVTPLAPSFDTVGIIAQSVELARRVFSILAPLDGAGLTEHTPKIVSGCWQTLATPDEDTQTAFQAALRSFDTLGFETFQTPLDAEVTSIVTAHRTIMHYEAYQAHGTLLSEQMAPRLKPNFRAGLLKGATISQDQAAKAVAFLAEAKQAFWAGLEGIDLILTLPVPEGTPLIDGTTGFQDWLTPWTVFGGPLLCLPWGMDRLDRPISIMLAARPGQDAEVLAAAAALEKLSPEMPSPQLPVA